MVYNNFVSRISKRFQSRFDEIDPQWNFDIGNEFEMTLATILEELLPDKFGVCRGFVTPMNGDAKGDDIIIYDKINVPLLKPPTNYKFTRKESVPLEATYSYIEAKNSIELVDQKSRNFIKKAISQVNAVNSLERADRPLNDIVSGYSFRNSSIQGRVGYPEILNPLFTVLFSRGIRINGELVNDYDTIIKHFPDEIEDGGPDLMILGPNLVLAPFYPKEIGENGKIKKSIYESPFCIEGRHQMMIWEMPEKAYGFGLCSLLLALQYIKLNDMPWGNVLTEELQNANKQFFEKKSGR